ncbi:hypothetical protein ACFW2D_10730 [Streptomyces sp. NPDC058914]
MPGGQSGTTDRYGRKRCFLAGLIVYAVGALLSTSRMAGPPRRWMAVDA